MHHAADHTPGLIAGTRIHTSQMWIGLRDRRLRVVPHVNVLAKWDARASRNLLTKLDP